jgi:hypothetical protein
VGNHSNYEQDTMALANALDTHAWEVYGVTAGTVHEGIRVYGPFVTWEEATAAAEALGGEAFTLMGRDITREY